MPTPENRLPILIGVGQAVDHWDGQNIADAPHPLAMMRGAIERAIADTGTAATTAAIDTAIFVRTFPDSLQHPVIPFGQIRNLPRAVLAGTLLEPQRVIYSAVGGDQPQALVNEFAAAIAEGHCEMALIAGGEVTGAMKAALRNGHTLNWADDTDGAVEDRGKGEPLLSRYEIKNGLGMPPQVYAAQEQAWRARHGLSTEEWREMAGRLFSQFSAVAAGNRYAQFPRKLSPEFIATPSAGNYPVCDPLLKWHVAQDAVNQSAALIMTSAGKAREFGIPEEKWIYLHGHADVRDALVSQRPDLSHSDAIRIAVTEALATTELGGRKIAHRDLYSCFPIVVMLAAEYLGIDPYTESLTVTGGLPFFGGPGNNYSTHAIASMVETLRHDAGSFGMVLANGGFISKESAGVYSAIAPDHWAPTSNANTTRMIEQRPEIPLLNTDCVALVEAYTVSHGQQGPAAAYIIGSNAAGRVIARVDPASIPAALESTELKNLVGTTAKIEHRDGGNFVTGFQSD